MDLEDLEPEDALRKLVASTFDYQHDNDDFIRLMNENMHRGEYLAQSKTIHRQNVPAINEVKSVYARARRKGQRLRRGVDPGDLHMSISALCFLNVANRAPSA